MPFVVVVDPFIRVCCDVRSRFSRVRVLAGAAVDKASTDNMQVAAMLTNG